MSQRFFASFWAEDNTLQAQWVKQTQKNYGTKTIYGHLSDYGNW